MAPVLLLGIGWSPDQAGGLNRYFRGLFQALRGAGTTPEGLVIGPARDAPPGLAAVSDHGARLWVRTRAYARAAAQIRPGVACVDLHFALYGAWPVLVGNLRSLPLIVHFHGPWADESATMGQHRLRVVAKRRIERAVYRRASQLIALSSGFKQLAVQAYGVPPWKVSVIPPGIDLGQFQPAGAGEREQFREQLGLAERSVVFALRRLVPRTGIDVLLRAWSEVGRQCESKATLIIGGDGPERGMLESLAADLGLGGSVRFLGPLAEEELAKYYQAADLTVVPSVALEGFGLVVLESLACGTPVVASSIGGLPDALEDLDASLLVPADDPAALCDRLVGAISGSRPLPSRDRCRRYAEGFSWCAVAKATRRVYRSAVCRARSSRPRVVYLDHCARLSGGEIALERLVKSLRDETEAHVILAERGPLVDRLIGAGISVEVLPMAEIARGLRRGAVRPGALPLASAAGSMAYAVKLARVLSRYRPDLVHTNSLKAAMYGTVAATLSGLPVVWHLRDRVDRDYLPEPAIKLVRAMSHRPAAIIANSQTTLSTLGSRRARSAELVTIPDMVDSDPGGPRLPTRGPRAGHVLHVGMVGRLAPWKGQHVFLDAFARAFARGQERAVLVGSAMFGEEQYEQELRSQAERLGLAGRVEFLGFREDVTAELRRLDFLVQASVIPEPFGQTVIEGMAAGLAVLAPDAGGPRETIRDGVDGLLYPPGDVAALAAAMNRLASDEVLRNRVGDAARARAGDFSPDVIAPRVLAVYERVLERRGAGVGWGRGQ